MSEFAWPKAERRVSQLPSPSSASHLRDLSPWVAPLRPSHYPSSRSASDLTPRSTHQIYGSSHSPLSHPAQGTHPQGCAARRIFLAPWRTRRPGPVPAAAMALLEEATAALGVDVSKLAQAGQAAVEGRLMVAVKYLVDRC